MTRFTLVLPALLASTACLSACTPPPSDGNSAASGSKSGSNEDGSAATASSDPGHDKGGQGAKGQDRKGDSQGCCIYCVKATPSDPANLPCGDECLPEGETCSADPGCACEGSERRAPKFKKGQVVRGGLIAADVPAYNAAQGDPIEGLFTIEQAFEGDETLADPAAGTLTATFKTSMGDFECELFEEKAPYTVANFVGLARGIRPFYDKKKDEWIKEPFYDGVLFHRVIEDFMLQTGDRTGTGSGGPGYHVPDEFDPSLRHTKPGVLSMANRNKPGKDGKLPIDPKTGQTIGNTGSSQFFVTVTKTPHLDNRHTVFGLCADAKIPIEISKVPVKTQPRHGIDHRPVEDVKLESITISRKKK